MIINSTLITALKENRTAVVSLSSILEVEKDGKKQKQFICVAASFINLSKDKSNPMREYTLLYLDGKFHAINRVVLDSMSVLINARKPFINKDISYDENGKTISSERLNPRLMGGQVDDDIISMAIGLGYKIAK